MACAAEGRDLIVKGLLGSKRRLRARAELALEKEYHKWLTHNP